MADLTAAVAQCFTDAHHKFSKAYDPNQPRYPRGHPLGGQWRDESPEGIEREKQAFLDSITHHKLKMYHGTSSEAWQLIKSEGLRPGAGVGADTWAMERGYTVARVSAAREASVYFTPQPEVAEKYARYAMEVNPGSTAVVLTLEIPLGELKGMVDDELSPFEEAYRLPKVIAPEWITGYVELKEGVDVTYKADGAAAKEGVGRIYAVILCDGGEDMTEQEKKSTDKPKISRVKASPEVRVARLKKRVEDLTKKATGQSDETD